MRSVKYLVIGLTLVALLAVGVIALAGNGFGSGAQASTCLQDAAASCSLNERNANGDGIPNAEDAGWIRPMDGNGDGAGQGYKMNLSENRPLDGTGFGAHRGGVGTGVCL